MALACTEYPYIFYGYDLGLGGKVGFTVTKLYKIARKLLKLPFEKSKVAYQTYDKMAEEGFVRAIKTKIRGREITIYTITEEGKNAMRESLENIQRIVQIDKEIRKLKKEELREIVAPRRASPFYADAIITKSGVIVSRPWREISKAWQIDFDKVIENWLILSEKGTELFGAIKID